MSTSLVTSERDRAKEVIGEIIRQMGGRLASKAELVRVFWRAHLNYAASQPGYLSFWPLVKTTSGPSIQDADQLLGELVAEGVLRFDESINGQTPALHLELAGGAATGEPLAPAAVEAIQAALASRGASPNLDEYQSLRSWNEAAEGEELNIYLDVIPEAEYAARKRQLERIRSTTELDYQRRLAQAGLLGDVKPRRRDQLAFESFTPAKVAGPPLSETVVQERR